MLRVFKPRAPMSLGTWSLSLFGITLGLAVLAAVLRLLGGPGWLDWIVGAAVCLAVIPAVGAILYKGVLFSVTSQPGWQEARWLGGYTSNSAILLGSSLLLALAAVAGQGEAADVLRAALLGLLLLDVVFFLLFYRGIAQAFRQRYGENGKLFFWLGVVAFGWILPFLLLVQGEIVEMLPVAFLLVGALTVRIVDLANDLGAQLVVPLVCFARAVRMLLLAAYACGWPPAAAPSCRCHDRGSVTLGELYAAIPTM
jgi:hypothetical protein